MNLTINNQPIITNPRPFPHHSHENHRINENHRNNFKPNLKPTNKQKSSCSSNLFGYCIGGGEIHEDQPYQVNQHAEINQQGNWNLHPPPRLNEKLEKRKHKISLSLKQVRVNTQTPNKTKQKKEFRHLSNGKRYITENAQQELSPKKKQGKQAKITDKSKTEPKKEPNGINIHQMKQSMKPSTNSGSNKKQSNKKSKLSLSSSFKSQMQPECNKLVPLFELKHPFHPKQAEKFTSSQELRIEESFMTAKLANIYGEMNNSKDLFSTSNIVYYNKLMTNEQTWRSFKPEKQESGPKLIYYRENPTSDQVLEAKAYERQKDMNNEVSIHKQMSQQSISQSIDMKAKVEDIRTKFMERKWIGEYVGTIKTFNQSQIRSHEIAQEESIILQRGCHYNIDSNLLMAPFNRGSTGEAGNNEKPESYSRAYGSVEAVGHEAIFTKGEISKRFINHPIQEDSINQEDMI